VRERAGGIAALVAAATFVFGFALFVSVVSDYTTGDPTPAESVAFLMAHQGTLTLWNVVIFIVFGIALVPLVLTLHERLAGAGSLLVRSATAFGLLWAGLVLASGMIGNIGIGTVADLHDSDPERAATIWSALDSVQNGLGGGNEIVGGMWVALVGVAALRTQALPRAASVLGIVSGFAGLVTVVPGLEPVGAVFGLGLIAWFAWVGVVLIRRPPSTRAELRAAA
jgi:hypothetical protein